MELVPCVSLKPEESVGTRASYRGDSAPGEELGSALLQFSQATELRGQHFRHLGSEDASTLKPFIGNTCEFRLKFMKREDFKSLGGNTYGHQRCNPFRGNTCKNGGGGGGGRRPLGTWNFSPSPTPVPVEE
jgi:hypothetical protein